MPKYLNLQEERRGTRRLYIGAAVVVAVIIAAAIVWPLASQGPSTSTNGPRTDQPAGTSTVAGQTTPPPSAAPNATTPETVGRNESIEASGKDSVSLNAAQRQAVDQFASQHAQQKMKHVGFTIAVGAAVPRTVSLAQMPVPLTDKLAAYSGDEYFIVPNQFVVVEKATRRIVAIIPVAV